MSRVVLVTGGAKGIGASIVRAFANAGDNVIVADQDQESGERLVKELGEKVHFLLLDIQDDIAIEATINKIKATFGGVHVLVNNACVYQDHGFHSTREQWHASLGVNVVSAAIMAQQVAAIMTEGAVIINMGSIGGKIAARNRLLYPVSKAAVLHLTKSLAVELAPKKIRVVSVSPAWTWTPTLAEMVNEDRLLADRVGAIMHPLGRVGDGMEVASVVYFLASMQASWITGVDIPVDGGFSALGPDQGQGPRYWFEQIMYSED